MKRMEQIKNRVYDISLAYDMSFGAGVDAEHKFHENAASDVLWLINEVERLEKENKELKDGSRS